MEEQQEIVDLFKGKEGVYKEGGRLNLVNVEAIKVDDWGVTMELRICDAKYATFDYDSETDDDGLAYITNNDDDNRVFTFSGAWGVFSYSPNHAHVAYVNGTLKTHPDAVRQFKNRETDIEKLWYIE